jgi:flavin reductase (DIM6/NTAB) family NADH-FMN oxidoreductase RutF
MGHFPFRLVSPIPDSLRPVPDQFMTDPDTFRSVLGRFASGVTVITARSADGRDYGMTVSAFCSVSLVPPLVLACVNHEASMYAVLRGAACFGVNILAAHQEAIARRFADPDSDRFDGIGFTRGEAEERGAGVVLIDDALAHAECRVTETREAGDHTVFIATVERAAAHAGRPLLYYRGGYAQLER